MLPEVYATIESEVEKIRIIMPGVDRSELGRYRKKLLDENKNTTSPHLLRRPPLEVNTVHKNTLKRLGDAIKLDNSRASEISHLLSRNLRGVVRDIINNHPDPYRHALEHERGLIISRIYPTLQEMRDL